jgi:hypothetical protein
MAGEEQARGQAGHGGYRSMIDELEALGGLAGMLGPGWDRRRFMRGLGTSAAIVAGGAVLGVPGLWAQDQKASEGGAGAEAQKAVPTPTPRPEVVTNIDSFMKVPRAASAIPGPFPGKVVQVSDPRCLVDDTVDAAVVREMLASGITRLTGKDMKASARMLVSPDDLVGLKVNPVGPPLISTRLELVDAVIRWLVDAGIPRKQLVIWDRFESMLTEAGFTADAFPGVRIEALQVMDEEGDSWRGKDGRHVSADRFDMDAYYEARGVVGKGVAGYKDDEFYLNQHVFNGERSYFGKLVTRELTRIINLPVFKNTGNGISMATKNLGYGALCNVGRLHRPLFFKVCTEVLAAPWVRDKLVLNITDGIRGQYDGGPGPNAQFVYPLRTIYVATDPIAIDMVGHRQLVAKRKKEGVKVDEHPRYTEYLYYAATLGLGVADPAEIELVEVSA